MSPFSPGDRLGGRYRIERALGSGGMGEVYEAWDLELSIALALKILKLEATREHEAVRRLKREVLLGRSVGHPHVCRVYDVGHHGEGGQTAWFLTMELLHGETLEELLRRRGRLPVHEALRIAVEMASGLGAAHRAGVVHRDFKGANVMLLHDDESRRAVVTDFGVARAMEVPLGQTLMTGPGAMVGTPAYMAPEQVRGEEAGPAADVYALGVVLFEVVTGRLPFDGKTGMEIATRRLLEDPPSPRSLVTDLDERWDAVILKCMSREPVDRFVRVGEVADALTGKVTLSVTSTATHSGAHPALPAERDAFVGREAELQELAAGFERGARQVTLLGAGGMGKTRLALRFGWNSLRQWPGGVWFCDLTEAWDLNGIASAVAATLGATLGGQDPVARLGQAIAGHRRCLVILDNFDQVVERAGETVERWLETAPEARFLVTSRERLNLPEEEVQAVEPLSADAGVELFLERARRRSPRFDPQGPDLEAVHEVVRLAEGMPLAIELAAARVRVMTPAQLVERMRERFRLLGGTGGGRHATLRAAIDGSWELLRPWEKAAWAQCALFEGGFTLDAAESVLDLTVWPEAPWVVDIVQALVEKSLLRSWVPETPGGHAVLEARFGMYVNLQEYAREKLREEGAIPAGASGAPAVRSTEERHGRWFARYGTEEAMRALDRHGAAERRLVLARELENLVAACRRAVARGDGETATAAYGAAWAVLEARGPLGQAVELGREVVAAPVGRLDRARALGKLAAAEWRAGRLEQGRAHFETALAIYREVGDRRAEGIVLGNLGTLDHEQGRTDVARAHLEAALAIHREVGDRRSESMILINLGVQLHDRGRIEEARAHYEQALAIVRETGDRRSEALILINLGAQFDEEGRLEEARNHYEAALTLLRQVGDRRSEGIVLGNLGILHREQGRPEEALGHFEAALASHREVGSQRGEAIIQGHLGRLYGAQGRIKEAAHALRRGEQLLRDLGDRFELGKLLCARAELEHRRGDGAAAVAALAQAEDLARQVEAGPDSELGRLIEEVRRTATAAPGMVPQPPA